MDHQEQLKRWDFVIGTISSAYWRLQAVCDEYEVPQLHHKRRIEFGRASIVLNATRAGLENVPDVHPDFIQIAIRIEQLLPVFALYDGKKITLYPLGDQRSRTHRPSFDGDPNRMMGSIEAVLYLCMLSVMVKKLVRNSELPGSYNHSRYKISLGAIRRYVFGE